MATRYGEFTLLEDLGASEVSERFRAMHDTLGGPFFVKRFSKLQAAFFPELHDRCERLIVLKHPSLAPHLGHGDVDGVPFAVSPWLEGVDLQQFMQSLRDRRVVLPLGAMLFVLREVALAVDALHRGQAAGGITHGDVTARHIRVGPSGDIWLTGLPTPRGLGPGRPAEPIWDGAGVAATVYDLMGLTRPGHDRLTLPPALERVVRRGLGIGHPEEQLSPRQLAEALDEAAEALGVAPNQATLREVAQRTVRAVVKSGRSARSAVAAALPTLEPIAGENRAKSSVPAQIELEPVSATGAAVPGEYEARVEAVQHQPAPTPAPPPQPSAPAKPPVAAPAPAAPAVATPPPRSPTEPPAAAPPSGASEVQGASPLAAEPPRGATAPLAAAPPKVPSIAVGYQGDPNEQTVPQTVAPGGDPLPPPPARPREITAITNLPRIEPGQAFPGIAAFDGPTQKVTGPAPSSPEGPATQERDAFLQEETSPELTLPTSEGDDAPLPPPSAGRPSLPPDMPLSAESGPGRPADTYRSELQGLDSDSLFSDVLDQDTKELSSPRIPLMAEPSSPDLARPQAPEPEVSATSAVDEATSELPRDQPSVTAPEERDPVRAGSSGGTGASGFDDDDPTDSHDLALADDRAVNALLKERRLSDEALAAAVMKQQRRGGRLVEILIADGVVADNEVADVVAEDAVKPRISDAGLMRFLPDRELLKRLPQTYAIDRRLLPLARRDDAELILAVADPYDERSIDEVSKIYGDAPVQVHVAALGALRKAVARAYKPDAEEHHDEHVVLLCTADDERAMVIGARFAQEGFAIQHAGVGHVAKNLLETGRPDAVLAEAELPEISGCDLLVLARADERHHETPFFVFGPDDDEALEARVLDLGGDDYFDRPLNLNVVVKKLRRALKKRPPRQATPSPQPVLGGVPAPPELPDFDGPTTKGPPGLSDLPDDGPELPHDGPAPFDDPDGADPFAAPTDAGFAEPTGVMGTLRQMAVSEIVQSLELGRKTARVELVPTDAKRGSFSFIDGQVVYAECDGGLVGEPAFFELAKAKEGFFRIHYGDAASTTNIDKPTTFLLLEAMRLMDEEGNPDGASA